jgi:hypothetical protein
MHQAAATRGNGILDDPALACRHAVLAFYDVDPWSRAELAEWLVGVYARVVAPRPGARAGGRPCAVDCGPPDDWPIRGIVLRTRLLIVEQVSGIVAGDDAAPIAHALSEGHVVAGKGGWVAVDAMRMELWERVWSLVAVDYLTNSADFLESVHPCVACGSLRASPCECRGRRQRSGIISRPPQG